jgi:hypothetical protein
MMIASPLARRRGLTLTEALVAMFVAAIGMISLLALFPLGALQMGQALKDARCTETATNAEALLRSHWRIEVLEKQNDLAILTAFGTGTGLSDPVFVDPIGRLSTAANIASVANLPRQRVTTAAAFGTAFRFCSLLDDVTFDESGRVGRYDMMNNPIPGSVERAGRYNWMAVLQRPNNGIAYEAKLTILVFDGRAAGFLAPNSELVYGDTSNATNSARVHSFVPGSSTLQLRFPATDVRPTIGKGRWLAIFTPANKLLTFHRVVSIGEDNGNTTTTQFDIELQTPIPTGTATSLGHDPANCRVIVLAGLAEVFERGPLTAH